jgi:seryl-tRNA synthetase
MLDADFIRQNPDLVRTAIANKREKADVDAFLDLDVRRRELLGQVESLRSERNANSQKVAELKRSGQDADDVVTRTREISAQIKSLESEFGELDDQFQHALLRFPNVPPDDTPVGRDENDNVEVRRWGERVTFGFEPKPHWDLARELDIIDFERATKITGTFFAVYKGLGARLERALISFMLDLHTTEHGYREIAPPHLVNRTAMTGTGQLPKLEEDMYRCELDDFFLIPTGEVPVTNLHADEVLDAELLPVYYTAYTPCFRREAGSYGRDTRGLMRLHQFDKVELLKFVRPETSYDELERLLANAETVVQKLGLEYRVLRLCTGELSFAAAKCYDIEVWAPGIERWLEVSSCSNFEEFQARRAGIRFREKGGKPQFVHTLNGSGTALARVLLAIIEQYQTADGTIRVPDVLVPYMGGIQEIR